MQVVADDLDVRTFAFQVFLRRARNLVAKGVVLADDVNLLDARILRHVSGQCFHLHVGVGIEAEVPEAALAVGKIRVDRRIVEEDDFLAGVAFIVLVHRIHQRQCDAGAVALGDEAIALVDDGLELVERFLRAALAVEGGHFNRVVAGPFLLVRDFGDHAEGVQLVLSDRSECAGHGFDHRNLDRIGMHRRSGKYGRNGQC